MPRINTESKFFAYVRRGLSWCAADLPGGRIENGRVLSKVGVVELVRDVGFLQNDGYEILPVEGGFRIVAGRPRGFLSGILNLAQALNERRRATERVEPRFVNRLYKHEANITGGEHLHTWVADLDEAFWVRYVKALARRHFTGLVFYAGYHPFEYFLDYERFPEAPGVSSRHRRRTLDGLKRAFGVARAFGLSTFMQHYITHFPAGLATKHGLGFRKVSAGSRLSAFRHPVVDAYSRYVYRRTFEILPELSGLYVNFESAPNSGDFVKRCLYPEAVRAGAKPEFIFRLWDFNSPAAMKDLVASYPGKTRLAHKVQDRADYYYYPKADPRVIEWKKHLPDTEFIFIMGPCHNSATVQSRQLWADHDFVHSLLADVEAKGADSIAFHTVYDLLLPDIPARKLAKTHEIEMARLNTGHLDATLDYVRGVRPGRSVLRKRLAGRLGLSRERAALALGAIDETSKITLTTFAQFWHSTSEEGYLYPAIRSYYQDPFLHLTPSFVNDEPAAAMTITTAWLNRILKLRNVPDDTGLIIDYANPLKKRVRHSVKTIGRELRKHCKNALALAHKAAGGKPSGVTATLVEETTKINNFGMRSYGEMQVAVNLFKVYFSKSRRSTLNALKKALEELKSIRPYIKPHDPLAARNHLWWHETECERDIKALRSLIRRIERDAFPYSAFAAFAASLERYNEIRRTVRPNKHIRPKDMRLIRRQLGESIERARESVELLAPAPRQRVRRNVEGWLGFLESELARTKEPVCKVLPVSAVGADDGFVELVQDNCFRYGANAIDDFLGFFIGRDWRLPWDVSMRIARSRGGLVLSLRERGVDVAARRRRWRQFQGTRSETFFWRFCVDRECTKRHIDIWSISPEGKTLIKGGYTILSRQDTVLDTGRPVKAGTAKFTSGPDWWRLDYTLPWRLLGGRPAPNEKWRVNITTTPRSGTPILPRAGLDGRNEQFIWCDAYEYTAADDFFAGKPERAGTIIFR